MISRIWSWLFRLSSKKLGDDGLKWHRQLLLLRESMSSQNTLKDLLEIDHALYQITLTEGGRDATRWVRRVHNVPRPHTHVCMGACKLPHAKLEM